jgi:N-acetylneuraminate synthase/N,N'-diacetyllegionaminate synthase
MVAFSIGDRSVGSGAPPYVIAEAGVNHNGDLNLAEDLIDAAATAGADAVKFQTFSTDRLVSEDAQTAEYQQEQTGADSQREILQQYELDRAAHERLQEYCSEQEITFLSTPFDPESVDLLVELGVPALKLGSGELDNHPLLEHAATKRLPLIVSTGMGTLPEVRAAHEKISAVDPALDVAFLHCTTAYPCDVADVNLRAMQTMDAELPVPVGYSDHTTLPETPSLAVAAGAQIVEKHFTMDRTLPGPDHQASLEPDELARAVELVRTAATALGSAQKEPTAAELENVENARKSLHAAVDIPAETEIRAEHVDVLRPATGLSPRQYDAVVGARATTDIASGEPIRAGNVAGITEGED